MRWLNGVTSWPPRIPQRSWRDTPAALRKLNCAVAEVDHQDLRQRATLAVATVAGEGFHARRVLVAAEREAERTPGVELLASDVTMYGPED